MRFDSKGELAVADLIFKKVVLIILNNSPIIARLVANLITHSTQCDYVIDNEE